MAVTVTTKESYGSRLGSSIKGVLGGLALFVIGFPVLFWNEGNSVKTAKALNEGEGACVSVESNASVDAANDGKLVHMTGRATTEDVLRDEEFGVIGTAIKLSRKVEMYQWQESSHTTEKKNVGGSVTKTTTYTHKLVWSSSVLESPSHPEPGQTMVNPGAMEFASGDSYAENVAFGAFRLSPEQIRDIGDARPYAFPTNWVCPVAKAVRNGAYVYIPNAETRNNALNNRDVVAQPRVGDMRVQFSVVLPHDVSLIAVQKGDTFGPYLAKSGKKLLMLSDGEKAAAEMFQDARNANTMLTWFIRLVGFLLMYIGLSMVLKPLSVLADVLPILGDIVGIGTGLVAGVIALVCALVTIGIAWLFYRPVLGVALIAASVALVWWLRGKRAAKKAAAAANQSAAPSAPVAAVAAVLFAASSAFAVVPEVKWGMITVKDGEAVSAAEAKEARARFDADGKTKPERVSLALEKADAGTVAALIAAFPEARSLRLTYSTIDDMAVVAQLKNLEKADFYASSVKDFAPLAACPKLASLSYYAVKGPQEAFDSLGRLKQLKELTGGASEVKSLEFLKELPQLEYFLAFSEAVPDLKPVGALVNLKHVKLWNLAGRSVGSKRIPEAGDLAYLAGCTKLEQIDLPGSAYSNLEALAGLAAVGRLDLSGAVNDVDLAFAKGYAKLVDISLRGARGKVSGFEALAGKPLATVNLEGAFDADVAFAKDCAKLTTLTLSSGAVGKTRKVANFAALKGHPALEYVYAVDAEGIDFETVKSLPKLRTLNIRKGAFTEEQVAELKTAFPKLRLTER